MASGLAAHAGVAQLVEHYLAKVDVAGSNPVSRSMITAAPIGAAVLLCLRADPKASDYGVKYAGGNVTGTR